MPDRLHHLGEDVAPTQGDVFQLLQLFAGLIGVPAVESGQPVELVLLHLVGGPGQLEGGVGTVAIWITKGVDANDRIFAGMLESLIIERLLLDATALVSRFHRPENTAPLADPLKLGEHRLFDHVGEFLDDKAALQHILVFGQAPLPVDDQLDGQGSPYRLGTGGGDGLVIGVGVQTVAVVIDGAEGLQGGADIVELDFLGMQ